MKKKFGKFLSILLTAVMLVGMLPATAMAEERKVVSVVKAAFPDDYTLPKYGDLVTEPTIIVTDGEPAYFPDTMQSWYKKNGERWSKMSLGETFGEGTYRYKSQLSIDGTTHVLASEGLSVIVDGENWDLISANDVTADGEKWNEGSVKVYDDFSFVWVASQEITLNASENQPLTFLDADRFDIGKNYVGRAITSYSVAGNVEGGTQPYTFSKVSGPEWISVSEEGVISGTPTEAGTNADLVVQVKDKKGAIATITIDVADTKINPDERTVVSVVKAKFPDDYTLPKYGDLVTEPTIIVTDGEPAYFPDTMQNWYKKNGDRWREMSLGETFGEGTYRYKSQLRIDDASGKTHVLASEGLSVIVGDENWDLISANEVTADGEKWNAGSVKVYDELSFVWVASPEFNMVVPELKFEDSDAFDIGKNYVGRAITSYSVAGNASGGTEPYTFSMVSGPAWINVSNEGVISGTPTAAGANTDLLVQVTDNKGAVKTIRIDVGDTKINPADREKISAVTATSDIDPKYGKLAAEPAFIITEGQPAYLNDNNWQKKVDGVWTDMSDWDTFEVGTYRYKAELRIDGKNFDGKDGTTHVLAQNNGLTLTVDGKEWAVMNPVDVNDDTSSVTVYSVEFTVKKSIVALDVKGIIPPVDGETADTSTIKINNGNGITVSDAQWLKGDLSPVDKFEVGETYYLRIEYTVDDDYTVANGAVVMHDLTGGTAEHTASVKTIVIAYTVPKTYTVTVETDGNGTASASHAKAAAGTKVTLTATPNEGYEFVEWEVPAHSDIRFIDDNSFIMPDNDVVVKASFKEKAVTPATYTVKFYANYGTGTMDPVTVASGEYTLPECGFTAPEGMRFKAWRIEGGDEYVVGETITISKDTWALAVWEYIPNPVIKTINIKGITVPVAEETAVTTGITTDTEGLVVNTVQWLTNTSTVMTDQKFEAGETYYLFVRFEMDTDHTVSDSAVVTHDLTDGLLDRFDRTDARSPWIRIEYTVPGGTPKTPIESVKISGVTEPVVGDKPDFDITLTGEGVAFDKEDYEDGICWYKYADGEWESLDADTTFGTGTYVLDVYLKVEDGFKLTRDTKYIFDEDELPDYEDVDFGVSCYSKYGDYVTLEIFFDVEDSDTPASYTVTVTTEGSGTASANPAAAAEGETVELTATPESGYEFEKWEVVSAPDGTIVNIENGKFTMPAGTVTVKAIFKEKAAAPVETYTVTVTTGGNGTASANLAAAAEGETVELTATPDSGYEFEKWEVVSAPDGTIVNIENGKFTMPAGAVTVKATFKAKAGTPEPVKYKATVENGSGDGEYAAGAEVTITADSRSGYRFVKWTSDDVTVRNDKDATTAFIMPEKDVTVTAVYEKVSSGSSGGGGSTKYKVTVEDTDNGTVESNRTRASKGTTVTITVDPEAGYEVDDIVVETKAGKEVEVTDKGDGKFTFKMPAANVTVSVDFAKAAESDDAQAEEEYILLTIDSVIAWVFDEYVANDVAPVIRNERTMLPARFVAEALGGVVTWDEEAQKVTIVNGEDTIEIFIGEPFATVNGNPVELDSPAFIENSRTYLPIRFIAENMGATVTWDADARTVTITP